MQLNGERYQHNFTVWRSHGPRPQVHSEYRESMTYRRR
jgi:hypothetical protein